MGSSLAGCFWLMVSSYSQTVVTTAATSSLDWSGESILKLTYVVIGRPQIVTGFCPEPSLLCHVYLLTGGLKVLKT